MSFRLFVLAALLGAGCSTAAPSPECGDGLLSDDEACDDGNGAAGDGCSGACLIETGWACEGEPSVCSTCGNGAVEEGEVCDDGYNDACGSCNSDCTGYGTGATCGDAVTCPELEACDDGFVDPCGTCNADCTAPGSAATCGDGEICPEEEVCDDGYADECGDCNATCSGTGSLPTCGDGVLCAATEMCDDGYNDACGSCNSDCSAPGTGAVCGDGAVCPELEACDDGYTDACGTCNADCSDVGMTSVCGDNMVCPETEYCDDGNTIDDLTCPADCQCDGDILLSTIGATASSSGGGSSGTGYGPERMIDGYYEASCDTQNFHWVEAGGSPGTAWVELQWSQPVGISSLAIDTQAATSSSCSGTGRALGGATVQWWDGAAWQTAGQVSGQTDDWSFTLPAVVTTTRVRLYGVYAVGGQNSNPIIFEWEVFGCP